jgi:hypothetical protein
MSRGTSNWSTWKPLKYLNFDILAYRAVQYCSKNVIIIVSAISSSTDYRYRLSIFWKPPIIFRYVDNLPIILNFEWHPLNINCNKYININLWAISSISAAVVIKLKYDSNKTKTDLVRWKTIYIKMIILGNKFSEKYRDNRNIRRFKYWLQLSIIACLITSPKMWMKQKYRFLVSIRPEMSK